MTARLTRREHRLINAALDAFAASIALTEVDNGAPATRGYSAADAAERYEDLKRYLKKLSRIAPEARDYARARFGFMVRETARALGLEREEDG